ERAAASAPLAEVATPGKTRCEDVAALLGVPLSQLVKTLVVSVEPEEEGGAATLVALLLRGDHELNEIKTGKLPGFGKGFRFASDEEVEAAFGCAPGFIGPVRPKQALKVIADRSVANMSDFIVGANRPDAHLTGVNWGRDLPEPDLVADLRNVVAGDPSPDGQGQLLIQRGIEVGHVFYLGTKYSEALKATFLDETGKPALMQMGCYGIGITRIAGAAIEQNHDERGIIWPRAIAPFGVVICPVGWGKNETVRNESVKLYDALRARGVDVILGDRDARPGVMFAEWELIGVPLRVTVGERGLNDGVVELQARRE